jgi:hypothetical protein
MPDVLGDRHCPLGGNRDRTLREVDEEPDEWDDARWGGAFGGLIAKPQAEEKLDKESLRHGCGLLRLSHTQEVVYIHDNIVAMEGAVPLNEGGDTTPGERGKGPTKGGAELPIHESFKLHRQQSRVEGVHGEVAEGCFRVREGAPGAFVRPRHDVSQYGHSEFGRGGGGRVSGPALGGGGIRDEAKLARLSGFGDESKGDHTGRSWPDPCPGTQEVAFLHFSIEVLAEGSRVLGGADVVRKVDAVDDGAGVHYVEAVAEHP